MEYGLKVVPFGASAVTRAIGASDVEREYLSGKEGIKPEEICVVWKGKSVIRLVRRVRGIRECMEDRAIKGKG